MNGKWRCPECGFCIIEDRFLEALNPFDEGKLEYILGCPSCKRVGDDFTALCEVRGCGREQCCGGPRNGVYMRTCRSHTVF